MALVREILAFRAVEQEDRAASNRLVSLDKNSCDFSHYTDAKTITDMMREVRHCSIRVESGTHSEEPFEGSAESMCELSNTLFLIRSPSSVVVVLIPETLKIMF